MSERVPAESGQRRPQRLPTVGDGQAPVTTVIVLAAAATAVIAGFVILRSIGDPVGGSGDAVSNVATTTVTTPLATSASSAEHDDDHDDHHDNDGRAERVQVRCHRRRGQRQRGRPFRNGDDR